MSVTSRWIVGILALLLWVPAADAGLIKDPACTSWCEQELEWCLSWCDPRTRECTECDFTYQSCVSSCPTICVEPRSVTTFTTQTRLGATVSGSACHSSFAGPQRWDRLNVHYRVDTWERTTKCDGTYTDRLLGSHETYQLCWSNSGAYCSFPSGSPGYPRCN
jgi:hypothetical protein